MAILPFVFSNMPTVFFVAAVSLETYVILILCAKKTNQSSFLRS